MCSFPSRIFLVTHMLTKFMTFLSSPLLLTLLVFFISASGLMGANIALSKVAVGYCNIATMMTDILEIFIVDMDGNVR
jgi:hypothetical protein